MTDRDYNECVQLHADKLYAFILKNIRSTEDAKDIVQSAYEKMWMKRSTVESSTAKSYLYTVAYHAMIDQIRKNKKTTELPDQPLYQPSGEYKKVLQLALSKLTETQRALIMLKDWEGYSYEEIARITGLNVAQVKVYLHRARIQVRKYIGNLKEVTSDY